MPAVPFKNPRQAVPVLGGRVGARSRRRLRDVAALAPDELRALARDLQARQIELELQNQELRQARQDLTRSKHRYLTLFDSAPVGYLILDPKGTILEANLAAANLLGLSRKDLLHRKFSRFVVRQGKAQAKLHFRAVFSQDGKQTCEVQLARSAGAITVAMECVAFLDPATQSRRCQAALIDVSPLKRLEEALTMFGESLEQRVAEETAELRRREQEFHTLADHVPAPFSYLGTDLRYRYVNRRFEAVFGRPAAEIIGRRMKDVVGKAMYVASRPYLDKALAGEPASFEAELQLPDGLHRLAVTCTPDFGPDAKVKGVFSLVQDLTASRPVDEQLRLRATALETAADGIIITDQDGLIQWVNQGFVRMTGYPADEVVGRSTEVLNSGEQGAQFYRDLWATVLAGKTWRGELVNRRKDGSLYWDEMTITPVPGSRPGQGHFIAIKKDITARKQAEQAVRDSEERFRLMVDTVSEYAIYLLDAEGRVVSWNAGAQRIMGYESQEILGRHVSVFYSPEAVAGGSPQQEFDQAVAAGHAQVEQWRVRKDASRFWAHVNTTTLRDEQGRLRGFARIIRDLTERRRLETAASAAAEAEKNRIASDLHDGLGPQLSGLGLLVEGLRLDLATVQPELAERAARLGDLLHETAVQTRALVRGIYSVSTEPDGLQVALESLTARTRRDASVRCQLSCPVPVAISDPFLSTHLYRIAQEAVHNAVKHSRASQISIELAKLDHSVQLSVRDDGAGFPPKPNGGLGLQSLRHRAKLIGGELLIRNTSQGGAEVVCTAPLSNKKAG